LSKMKDFLVVYALFVDWLPGVLSLHGLGD
jgi:hypothetical protein